MRVWLQAVRPLAQLNLVVPILFGEAFAFYILGAIDVVGVLLAHLFALTAQPSIIFANDLADEFADGLRAKTTVLAGGSRVLVEGKLTRSQLRTAMRIAWALHLLVGAVAAMWLGHWVLLLCASLTLALTHAYSFRPLRLSYRAMGGTLQGMGTGIVLPVVGSVLAAKSLVVPPWMILFATFLLGLASNWITSVPDAERDRLARKWSLAGRFGARRAAACAAGVVGLVSLSGFSDHGSLPASAMMWPSFVSWCPLLLAVFELRPQRLPEKPRIRVTWLLLTSVQVLWLGWCVVLVAQRS